LLPRSVGVESIPRNDAPPISQSQLPLELVHVKDVPEASPLGANA
jgi:hypothetical protein